jgi:hypothetical protein
MHGLGILLLVVSVLTVIYALLQRRKANKIAGAAFHPTGQLASNPALGGGKGLVSAEGMAFPQGAFVAPCSGQPCVYYEVRVQRVWEKTVKKESGYSTERGTTNLHTDRAGTTFLLDDGSGPVTVDAREKVSAKLKKAFDQTQNVVSGDVIFGQYRAHVPHHSGSERVLGIQVVEEIFAPTGKIFAMGKLAGGALTKTDGMLGGLELHPGGRDEILGKSAKHAKVGFIAGAVMFAPGLLSVLLFKAAPPEPDHSCQAGITDTTVEACSDRLYDDDGKAFSWKVTKAGTYAVDVTTPPEAAIALDPEVTVKDATGAVVFSGAPQGGHALVPGSYTINVHDGTKGRAQTMTGGFGFTLKVTQAEGAPPAAAPPADSASAAPATAPVVALNAGKRPAAKATTPASKRPKH